MCIREMIEDTPSMTAFSTARSALRKASSSRDGVAGASGDDECCLPLNHDE